MANDSDSRIGADALLNARIVDAAGSVVSVVALDRAGLDTLAWVCVADGPQVLVPASVLTLQNDGVYRLPFTFNTDGSGQISLPVMREEMQVGKRTVDTGRGVRLHKTVTENEQRLDHTLRQDELVVEHVVIGTPVPESDLPTMRYDGDTLVVPILEEVLVVQKQLRLKEEIRITRQPREARATQTVRLRTEHVEIERFDESENRQA
jgi:uncharacterized protein (TIGR02271 family)